MNICNLPREKEHDLERRYELLNRELRAMLAIEGKSSAGAAGESSHCWAALAPEVPNVGAPLNPFADADIYITSGDSRSKSAEAAIPVVSFLQD